MSRLFLVIGPETIQRNGCICSDDAGLDLEVIRSVCVWVSGTYVLSAVWEAEAVRLLEPRNLWKQPRPTE